MALPLTVKTDSKIVNRFRSLPHAPTNRETRDLLRGVDLPTRRGHLEAQKGPGTRKMIDIEETPGDSKYIMKINRRITAAALGARTTTRTTTTRPVQSFDTMTNEHVPAAVLPTGPIEMKIGTGVASSLTEGGPDMAAIQIMADPGLMAIPM